MTISNTIWFIPRLIEDNPVRLTCMQHAWYYYSVSIHSLTMFSCTIAIGSSSSLMITLVWEFSKKFAMVQNQLDFSFMSSSDWTKKSVSFINGIEKFV